MSDKPTSPFTNDRLSVRALHQAYADKIESYFAGLARIPGGPCDVRLRTFGPARVAIAHGDDWLNRATLTGDEDLSLVDEMIDYFAAQGERCHVEWNPSNCYRSGTWNDELGSHLLGRSFRPGGFRCVWVAATDGVPSDAGNATVSVRRFTLAEVNEYLALLAVMEGQSDAEKQRTRANVAYGQSDGRWQHYVGYVDQVACGSAILFTGTDIGYLEWGQTQSRHRGRGLHGAMIRRRVADARAAGCATVFAVTDVGVPSARNLQRAGFRLAYNYVMLIAGPPADGRVAVIK